MSRLQDLVERLARDDLRPQLVTGGGTGTHAMDSELDLGMQVQVGTYVFMDLNYRGVEMRPAEPFPFAFALTVRTTVISAAQSVHRD